MKNLKVILMSTSLAFSSAVSAGWLDFLNQADNAAKTVQNTTSTIKTINNVRQNAQAVAQVGLVDTLVKQLGVTSTQATGGSGALFQIAKAKMTESAFSQLSQSIPGMDGILAAVPKTQTASTTNNLLGGLAAASGNSTLINAASLVDTFQQLNLSKEMIAQFTPIVINYVKQNSGEVTANLLQAALSGL